MPNVYQSLLLLLAGATQKELARQVKYLKVENQILRSRLPERIVVTAQERQRLVKFAHGLGSALHHLATIVKPATALKWIREEKRIGKKKRLAVRRGRPRTPEQIRQLVIRLAKENEWGYTRILGELKKLGIRSISRNTVKRILQEQGLEPGPQRGEGTWDEFLKQHAASLWQCDFFSRRVITPTGIRSAFVLVFLNVKTRQVILSPATLHPNEAWVVEQAERFVRQAREQGLPVTLLQHDRDTKFTKSFDGKLKILRVQSIRNAYCSPNTNAYVERFIQSICGECLDRFLILGLRHMNYLCREYLAYYHHQRPHQSLDNAPLIKPKQARRRKGKQQGAEAEIVSLRNIHCEQRLGGLLKSYSRRAA